MQGNATPVQVSTHNDQKSCKAGLRTSLNIDCQSLNTVGLLNMILHVAGDWNYSDFSTVAIITTQDGVQELGAISATLTKKITVSEVPGDRHTVYSMDVKADDSCKHAAEGLSVYLHHTCEGRPKTAPVSLRTC